MFLEKINTNKLTDFIVINLGKSMQKRDRICYIKTKKLLIFICFVGYPRPFGYSEDHVHAS